MARKKIVFVIVEGPSDDTALGVLFTKIFDKNHVHIEIMHGDITSDPNLNPVKIVADTAEFVKKYAKDNHYETSHFQQIIHIIDTDGAYVSDEKVIQDDSIHGTLYSPQEIRTNNRDGILRRNRDKRLAMNKLFSRQKIWNIPYKAYYMSSNLDHVLYDKQNSSDEEKENDSYAFAKKYKNDVPGFLKFISESSFSIREDYMDSWKYIQKENHSLERHTNLGLCFESRNIDTGELD